MRSISRVTTLAKSLRKSSSEKRSGKSSANVLIATKGLLISWAMPDASAPIDARRSACCFSPSRVFRRVRSLNTATAPRTVPALSRRGGVEQGIFYRDGCLTHKCSEQIDICRKVGITRQPWTQQEETD